MGPLKNLIEETIPNVEVVSFLYGWTSGLGIRLPFYGLWTRRRLTKKLQKFLVRQLRREPPGTQVDAIGHSFGTWLIHRSMTYKGRVKAFYRRIIYAAGIVSSRENFEDEAGHYSGILNLYSREDDVVRLAPFGHAGYNGFFYADRPGEPLRVHVINADMTPFEHDDYTQPGKAWELTLKFLKEKPKPPPGQP